MDTEKKQLVEDFNIERFLEWQNQFYEAQEIADAKHEADAESAWVTWQKFREAQETGQPTESHRQPLQVSKVKKAQDEKVLAMKVWDKAKMPVMEWESFYLLKSVTENAIEAAKAEITDRIEQGIFPAKTIFERRLAEAWELIDFDLLHWVSKGQPLLQHQNNAAISTLSEVAVYQWASEELKELAAENEGAKGSEPLQQAELPAPLKWEVNNLTLLYLLFAELQRIGFLDEKGKGNSRQIARWLKLMFGLNASEQTIYEQIGRLRNGLVKQGKLARLRGDKKEVVELVRLMKEVDEKENLT